MKFDVSVYGSVIDEINKLEDVCGVYFLSYNSEICYVGQSRNIKSRLRTHFREKQKPFNEFSFVVTKECNLESTELFYILDKKPSFNVKDSLVVGNKSEFIETNNLNDLVYYEKSYKDIENDKLCYNPTEAQLAERYPLTRQAFNYQKNNKPWLFEVYCNAYKYEMLLKDIEDMKNKELKHA